MRTTVSTISSTTEPMPFLISSSLTASYAIFLLQRADFLQPAELPEFIEPDKTLGHGERVSSRFDLAQHLAHCLAGRHQRVHIEARGLESHRLDLRDMESRHHRARRMVVMQRNAAAEALGHRLVLRG